MFKWLNRKFTKNYTEVPLLLVEFDLDKYKTNGAKNSCMIRIHPELKGDKYIQTEINKVIDYIRENYDMEKLSK